MTMCQCANERFVETTYWKNPLSPDRHIAILPYCLIGYFRPMELLTPTRFPDYELIDCGHFEKLERFGKYITIRPEPQAVWDAELEDEEWESMAHVRFVPKSSSSGTWK